MTMPTAPEAGYQAFNADVAADGDPGHTAYLKSIEQDTADAITKIKGQIEGLNKSLTAKQAELKSVRSALKNEG
jgi:hypothetical protein